MLPVEDDDILLSVITKVMFLSNDKELKDENILKTVR